jgi:hypothetical protein
MREHWFMRGVGDGSKLWRGEVVLRVPARNSERNQRRLVTAVAEAAGTIDADDVPRMSDVSPASSYDIQPPEPDRGVGIACWVLADSVGHAAQTVWEVVEAAARTLTIDASLWDLRVIPRDAILSAPITGTRLTK